MVNQLGAAASPDAGFVEVVSLIQAARLRALQAVNIELVDLYWHVGAIISRKIGTIAVSGSVFGRRH
jgi:hypothetical protein